MDEEVSVQLDFLSRSIHSILDEVRSASSMKELVVVFQELVVKLLQFSSKLHQIRKVSKDDLQRESLKLLLRSIKMGIPELSLACQKGLRKSECITVNKKEEIIQKLVFSVDEAMEIIAKQNPGDVLNPRQSLSKEQPAADFIHWIDDALSDLTTSHTHSELVEDFATSVFGNEKEMNPSKDLSIQDIFAISRKIKKQIGDIFGKMEMLLSHEKIQKQSFGKQLLKDIENFAVLARSFGSKKLSDSSKLDETVAEFHQLGFDLVAMVIDCDVGMPEDDFEILLKVQTHFESFLDDIVTFLKQGMGEEDLLKSNENQARDIVDEVINHVSRRNYIGLADASYLFIAKCEESKKILYALNEESDFAKQFCKYERKLKQDLSGIESVSDELIENINDRSLVQVLQTKMLEIIHLLSDCRKDIFARSPCDKIEKKRESRDEEKDSEDAVSDFPLLVAQFPKAIYNSDYQRVEILSNRFLGRIKQIGDLLQRISFHSIKNIRDLRQHFAKYFKTAGGFCSQARKAVLSDLDGNSDAIKNLLKTGKEMEVMKNRFISECKKFARPLIDIPGSFQSANCRDAVKKQSQISMITTRLKTLMERLADTEYIEEQGLRKELSKLSNIITDSANSLSCGKKAQTSNMETTDEFLADLYSLKWTFAVINIFEIVDGISVNILKYDRSMSVDNLRKTTATWISMLQRLSTCCSDSEGSKEISKTLNELSSLSKIIQMKERREGIQDQIELAITRRELSANILVSVELTDILTQDVREPMRGYIDPLASLSFAPNLQSYIAIRDAFEDKVDTVHTMSCLAVQDSSFRSKSHVVFVAADEFKMISQDLIEIVSSDAAKKDLDMCKLRWRLAATYLVKVLLTAPEANYSAVSGVMRHLQTTSHVCRYEDLIAILKDVGSTKGFSKDSWAFKSRIHTDELFSDEIGTDFANSGISSILGHPKSRENDFVQSSSSRMDKSEATYFRNFSLNEKEDSAPPLPLIQTPDTFNPQSSFSSTRSTTSQDTEIFIQPKAERRVSPGLSIDSKRGRTQGGASEKELVPERIVPLGPSRNEPTNMESVIAKDESRISKSIAAAAQILLRELEEWEEDGNSIITVVKKMTQQMLEMADFAKGKGELRSKEDFINTAKAIAANAHLVAKFAIIVAEYCLDEPCQINLLHYAELVPTISTQLNIIASVKAATPNDETADVMLIANAENLMKSVSGTLKAAESASVKMRFDPERGNGEVRSSSAALAIKWKKKLDLRRSMESITAPTNELGLKIIKDDAALSITDL